jgi:hypothetical protein
VRLPNSPMTRAEFEGVLADAIGGITRTGTGAWQELSDALETVAADAPDPDPKLIDAARDAFLQQVTNGC